MEDCQHECSVYVERHQPSARSTNNCTHTQTNQCRARTPTAHPFVNDCQNAVATRTHNENKTTRWQVRQNVRTYVRQYAAAELLARHRHHHQHPHTTTTYYYRLSVFHTLHK